MINAAAATIIDMKAIEEDLKKRLSTEEEPVETIPLPEVEKEILQMIENGKKNSKKVYWVFDGFIHPTAQEFLAFIDNIGAPDYIIKNVCEDAAIRERYKKIKEADEIGEE